MKRALTVALITLLSFGFACKKDANDAKKKSLNDGWEDPDVGADVAKAVKGIDHVVLFWIEYGGALVPLACFDDDSGKYKKTGACLGLVPVDDAKVKISRGDTVPVNEEETVVCEPSGEEVQGLRTGMTSANAGEWAVWPPRLASRVRKVGTKSKVKLSPEQLTALKRKVKKVAPDAEGKWRVNQSITADLTGDGEKDIIASVTVENAADETQHSFSGLLLVDGKTGDVQVLQGSPWETFTVVATFDLNEDKKTELLVYSAYYEGDSMTVEQYIGGQLETVGGWGCGA